MRVSIVSMVLVGGMLALGGCSTVAEPGQMTLAERTEQCRQVRTDIAPTGRQTGDARNDYDCRTLHAIDRHDAGDRKDVRGSAARAAGRSRALRNGT